MQENNREISILKQRILQFANAQGISKYELYQKTGISNGVFSQKGGVSEDNLLKFLSYYNYISEKWLLRGQGPMTNKNAPEKPEVREIKASDNTSALLIKRLEELSVENSILRKEVEKLTSQKNYQKSDCLPVAAEP